MFDNILARRGRLSQQNRDQILEYANIIGVNYADSLYTMPANQSPYAKNVDFGDPIGDFTKRKGYESMLASLGPGKVLGLNNWQHSAGDLMVMAWSNYLYLLSGDAGSIAKSSQEDWEAGALNNIDTTTSLGDMMLVEGEAVVDFTDVVTATADFNGTRNTTEATDNKVVLTKAASASARFYIQNAPAGYDPSTERGGWEQGSGYVARALAKTKAGSIENKSIQETAVSSAHDVLLIKAVTAAIPINKTIAGTLKWCLGCLEGGTSPAYAADMVTRMHIFVTQGDSDNVRGSLLTYQGSSEWSTSTSNCGKYVDAQTLNAVEAQAGDRIVIEMGYRANNSTKDPYWGSMFYGGTNDTDLSSGGNGSNYPGWFEFSEDPFEHYNASGSYTHGELDISPVGWVKTASLTYHTTAPANTAAKFQVRFSYDAGVSWDDWNDFASGSPFIDGGADVRLWRLQWRVLLSTDDSDVTPSLDDVTVDIDCVTSNTGEWLSGTYDLGVTPTTNNLDYSITVPDNTSVHVYARGSSSGTVFGDWQEVLASGDPIPLQRYIQIKVVLTSTDAQATPTFSDFLISYGSGYTIANKINIAPLGRADDKLTGNRLSFQNYEDWLLCADGLKPFMVYKTDASQETGTAQAGGTSAITLKAEASAIDGHYVNAFLTITGGTGTGQTRWISGYNGDTKVATVSEAWETELAAANLLTDNQASVETDLTGFSVFSSATISRDTTEKWHGTASLKVVTPGAVVGEGVFTTLSQALAAGDSYTGSAWVKGNGTVRLFLRERTGGVETDYTSDPVTLTGDWQRLVVVHPVADALNTQLLLAVRTIDSVQAVTFYVDGLQLEKRSSASDWHLPSDTAAQTTYSIGSALRVRNLGIVPPAVAPSGVDSGTAGSPNGAYKLMVTYINHDGVESNPSEASEAVTVSSKKITWTIPVDASLGHTTVKRKLYRTAAGGAVYKYLATLDDNTTTTYTDNTADIALGSLMLDNNNVPPETCSLLFTFTGYVFYVTEGYYVRFSKTGAPDQCPYTESDVQEIVFPDAVLDIKSSPIALAFGGASFLASITSNGGFVFDSDPSIDTTTMKVIDTHGGMSHQASAMCISPNLKSTLVVNTDVGLRSLIPGLQDDSVESVPFSKNIQKYYDRSINKDQAAGVFYSNYYLYSMEYRDEDAASSERLTFAYDFRTEQWMGPWTFGMSCYAIQGNDLYAGDGGSGRVYKMFTGSTDAGAAILMECDLPARAPASEAGTCKFKRLMAVVHGESNTSETVIKPKVDERECSIVLGALATTFTGDTRPGHDFIRSKKYKIALPRGHTYSLRIVDHSVNPLRIMKIITEYEVLPLKT